MRILMGVDDSKFAGESLKAVLAERRPENSEVMVMHVLQPVGPTPPQMAAGYVPELEAEKDSAEALVEGMAKQLRSAGFKAQSRVVVGDIREELLDSAAEWKADLIMVGSRGTGGIQRLLLGSVPEFVARHAKCSVEIVRGSQNGHHA